MDWIRFLTGTGLVLQTASVVPPLWITFRPSPNTFVTDPADPEHTDPNTGMILDFDTRPDAREKRHYIASVALVAIGALLQLVALILDP